MSIANSGAPSVADDGKTLVIRIENSAFGSDAG